MKMGSPAPISCTLKSFKLSNLQRECRGAGDKIGKLFPGRISSKKAVKFANFALHGYFFPIYTIYLLHSSCK